MKTLSVFTLEHICQNLGEKLKLYEQGLHIAALFQDNDHNEIIGWAILNESNEIIKKYDDIENLYNDYKQN